MFKIKDSVKIFLFFCFLFLNQIDNRELVECTCTSQINLLCTFDDGEEIVFSDCYHVDLSSRSISKIRGNAFSYNKIDILNLENNYITRLPDDILDSMNVNGKLNLKKNCIGPLQSIVLLSNFPSHLEIIMTSNPTNCIENNWLLKKFNFQRIHVTCDSDVTILKESLNRCNKKLLPDKKQIVSCSLIKFIQETGSLNENVKEICDDLIENTNYIISKIGKEEFFIESPLITFSKEKIQKNAHIYSKIKNEDLPNINQF